MKFSLLLFIIAEFSFGFVYPQKYKVVAKPNWVKSVDIPANSPVAKHDVTSGHYLALADHQVNLDENAIYNHEVINVCSYSGVTKASQLMITYDTSYQQVKIHHLHVWRKGVKLDRTNSLSFEIMNNEYDLQNGIYMGRITAYNNLTDIRKDDLIDFAYTLVGKNPIFENGKYLFIPLEANNPIDLYFIRILYAKNKDYKYNCFACDSNIKFSDELTATHREIEISTKDLKAIKLEENIPRSIIPYRYFTLSSFKTWTDINTWAQNVFAVKKEPDLQSVFKEIFTGTETRDEKINKLIDFVQDDIRYMGIEAGIGSIKPFSPDQVVKQRFGDCKDKSLLLVSLLKKIGISQAYPALVNVSTKSGLNNLYPSNEVFNHCIVQFDLDSTTYWIDPTLTQQGGDYKNVSIDDYGKALVVGKPADTLTKMPLLNLKSGTKIKDELFIKSFTEPSTLEIKSTRYGYEADKRRIALEQNSADDLTKFVADELKLMYPTVEKTADLIINDDIKNNIISTTYKYDVSEFWQDGDKLSDKKLAGYWMFKIEPRTLYQYLKTSVCDKRKFDYALAFPLNLNYRTVFHFPKDLLIYDKYLKYDNPAFALEIKTEQLSSNSFQITYNLNTKSSFISAENYEKVCEEKNKIVKNLPMVIYFSK